MMHDLEMHEPSQEFVRCWQAAGHHIQGLVQGQVPWLRAHLNPPFLEHLSFRLGNQLFFIRVEDVEGRLTVPGGREGLLAIASGCRGYACVMPMRFERGSWTPAAPGWGLTDLRSGESIDPVLLINDERIEMTEWELQDFAVQIVRDSLADQGRELMSWQGNPAVSPSIWFVGDEGPEWVIVRVVRHSTEQAVLPVNWREIASRCAAIGRAGHFASVSVASAEDEGGSFEGNAVTPLWRGHAMTVSFAGLQSLPV